MWKIHTDPLRRIALGVRENNFEVEPGSSIYSCNHDWLSVYDGDSKDARRIGSFCGSNGMRGFHTIHSSGRHLYVEFLSDGQQRRAGFHLEYLNFFQGMYNYVLIMQPAILRTMIGIHCVYERCVRIRLKTALSVDAIMISSASHI